ncbi:MAG: SulP family inorganic anion transporter [Acidimicrobiia bacterium]|nr:SulP family inorganic anion transporter [Acidimicrobiia bacterium]
MKFAIAHPRSLFARKTARDDAMAGLVLGVESVPDGLASGLLAGVNPVFGLYGYLFGMVGGALFTSTAFMAVQATGAMSIIVADVGLGGHDDPARSLFTLSILTGAVMIVAGLLRLGSFLRFVSNSVMTGFVSAVGINIVLGQLGDFTGYAATGRGRLGRTVNLLLHPNRVHLPTLIVGIATIVLIVYLQRTRLGPLGLVVAVFAGSAVAAVFGAFDSEIALVGDVADVPRSLPFLHLPLFGEIPSLFVPAVSLAFVGLVQGAGVSAGFPNRDGSMPDASQDFVGQGAGNIASGLFQGMPVGGSMSASSLTVGAGARTRAAMLYAGVVMALMIVVFGSVVELVAMPALAALLIVVGIGTVKPAKVVAVGRTGSVPLTVMSITLVLTMIIPLQFAVLVGVGMSILLFVIRQSSRLITRRIVFRDDDRVMETDPPAELPANEVVVLQPYGAIFFATATVLLEQMPELTSESHNSVVILRIRGADEAGATLLDVLANYARSLREADCKLVIVTDNEHVIRQLDDTGKIDVIGHDNVYRGTAFIGETVRRAHIDALAWVAAHTSTDGAS